MSISLSLKFTLKPFIVISQYGRKYLVFLVYLHSIGFLGYFDYYDFSYVCFSYLGVKKHSIKTNNSKKKSLIVILPGLYWVFQESEQNLGTC